MAASSLPARQIAESVCPGHPDKVADQISDAVVDAHLAADPQARVNCEVLVTRDRVVATGQITANAEVDIEQVVRDVLDEVGYHDLQRHGMSAGSSRVDTLIDRQSPEIAGGVDRGGAGDSGIMYGFACDETAELLPLSCVIAHDVARRISTWSCPDGPALGPDGKVQVELEVVDGQVRAVVVVSAQHTADIALDAMRELIADAVVAPSLRERGVSAEMVHVNPAGTFVVGGPSADAGLTGRKLMVDTYGGLARHGGGCFSGKDATKVDRSGAYVARYLAANVVAAGVARRCQIGIAYAIGRPLPVWFDVDCFGTSEVDPQQLRGQLQELIDLRVEPVLERLRLRHVRYRPTATFGHFGRRSDGFPWENLDLIEDIQTLLGGHTATRRVDERTGHHSG
jgi:S-adenosylmethionine synthetase